MNEIYLVLYKEKYCGEFSETYKKIFTIPLRAIEFIEILHKDNDVSDIRLFVCYEQDIDYLKENRK